MVKPKDLTAADIHVEIGATWIPPQDIERFIRETFDVYRTESVARTLFARLHSDKLKLIKGNEHSKLFICDDDFYVITSFNPLSFDGDYSKENQRGEIGELSRDKSNLLSYRSFFF